MLQALLSQSAHVIPNSLFPPGCRRRGDSRIMGSVCGAEWRLTRDFCGQLIGARIVTRASSGSALKINAVISRRDVQPPKPLRKEHPTSVTSVLWAEPDSFLTNDYHTSSGYTEPSRRRLDAVSSRSSLVHLQGAHRVLGESFPQPPSFIL